MSPFSILVVCTANICRSPTAEYLLRSALVRAGRGPQVAQQAFQVSSAGIRGWDGAEMDPPAAAALRTLGEDPTDFRARSFTEAMGERADLILTATKDHRRLVLEAVPKSLHRTFTLIEFAHLVSTVDVVQQAAGDPAETVRRVARSRGEASIGDYDIEDTFGQPPEVHRATAVALLSLSQSIAAAVAGP